MDDDDIRPDAARLKLAAGLILGIVKWSELGRYIGQSDQNLTNWKRRGLPRDEIMDLAEKLKCNPYWLRDGRGQMAMPFALDADMSELYKVAEPLHHDARQYLIKQAVDLAEFASKKTVNSK